MTRTVGDSHDAGISNIGCKPFQLVATEVAFWSEYSCSEGGYLSSHTIAGKVYSRPEVRMDAGGFSKPLVLEGSDMSGSHDPNDPTPGQSVSSRILVIEDSFFQAVEITNILKADGHQVQTARDGTTGLHLAKTWLPRIILLDLGLPDIHGLDVVDRLRAEEATRAMAIIVMTGYAMQHAAAAARLGKGLDGLLLKPFSPADLRRVISPLPS